MADLRTGTYGQYYGSIFTESVNLTAAEREVNAQYIYSYLIDHGWTVEAIAGILGNMQHESGLNPGRWQSDRPGRTSSGYSLTQWTPASKYINWCESVGRSDPSEMDNALARIIWELENGEQYYKTTSYPLNFRQFSQSTDSPYYLACAFAWNYERSWTVLYGSESEKESVRQARGGAAQTWYKFLTGTDPTPPNPSEPVTPTGKKKGLSLLLLLAATRKKV